MNLDEQQVVNSNPNTVQNNNENIMLNNISSELVLKTPSKDINDSMSSLSQSSGCKFTRFIFRKNLIL